MRWSPVLATLIALGAVPWTPTGARSQVVINEIAYDDSQEDDEELVELFHTGDAALDLTDWTLRTGDGNGPGPAYPLPAGTTIGARGYLVAGSPGVPGVDIALAGANLFGDGPAYIALWNADEELVDAVLYETNKGIAGFPPEVAAERGIWGNHVLVASTRLSWQRWFDGRDTDRNDLDFGHLPWTPGGSNDRADPAELEDDFESGVPEADVPTLPGSFVPGRIVDPLQVSPSNPNAVDESPDGGLALIAWDPAGGGNFVVHDAAPAADMMFEAWVYFDATPEAGDESETWSIGLAGTSGTFYNIPVLFDANGNTGVTWTYQVTSAGATLYLIDEGHGLPAAERVHLGAIAVTPGVNDGWQRLRLEVAGDRVVGYFGGERGSTDDGLRIEGTRREPGAGSFYIGYREAVTDNASVRPPTLDSLVVRELAEASPRVQRGDANADASTNLSDAVAILNHLFAGGAAPLCVDAADADDDGAVNITDAVRLLNHLFVAGAAPPAPFGECGVDPTDDGLECSSFPPCS